MVSFYHERNNNKQTRDIKRESNGDIVGSRKNEKLSLISAEKFSKIFCSWEDAVLKNIWKTKNKCWKFKRNMDTVF